MKIHPLREWRLRNGQSLDELSAIVGGITKASLSRIETGEQNPSLDLIGRIVTATNGEVSANDFLQSSMDRAS